MVRGMRLALAVALLAAPLCAETPMSASEFEAYAKGRTLTFATESGPYGIERYLPGRRVIWSFLDGECQEGVWYEEGSAICFLYDFDPEPQCWEMFAEGDRLRAVFLGDPGTTVLYEAAEGDEALICNDFGV